MLRTFAIAALAFAIGAPAAHAQTSVELFEEINVDMAPTIPKGRVVSASKIFSQISRGDIVAFRRPRTGNIGVKRIIGLPGEKIQMKGGRLYINGTLVPRDETKRESLEYISGQVTEAPTYIETPPGGAQYRIAEIDGDSGRNDNTSPFEVPAGNYFVLGDNRDNSTDSRVPLDEDGLGYVPARNLVGIIDPSGDMARHDAVALPELLEFACGGVSRELARRCREDLETSMRVWLAIIPEKQLSKLRKFFAEMNFTDEQRRVLLKAYRELVAAEYESRER